MKKLRLTILVILLLTACGGSTISEQVASNIDINHLPDTVDIQTVAQIKEHDNIVVLDVREQGEYDEGHISGVTLIPMSELPNRLSEIPTDKEVIVTCRSGNRSEQVTEFLRQQGYTNIHNMEGGILAWEAAGLSVEK